MPVHSVRLTYGRNTNIASVADTVVPGFYNCEIDILNRLIDTDEGELSSREGEGGGGCGGGTIARRRQALGGVNDRVDANSNRCCIQIRKVTCHN